MKTLVQSQLDSYLSKPVRAAATRRRYVRAKALRALHLRTSNFDKYSSVGTGGSGGLDEFAQTPPPPEPPDPPDRLLTLYLVHYGNNYSRREYGTVRYQVALFTAAHATDSRARRTLASATFSAMEPQQRPNVAGTPPTNATVQQQAAVVNPFVAQQSPVAIVQAPAVAIPCSAAYPTTSVSLPSPAGARPPFGFSFPDMQPSCGTCSPPSAASSIAPPRPSWTGAGEAAPVSKGSHAVLAAGVTACAPPRMLGVAASPSSCAHATYMTSAVALGTVRAVAPCGLVLSQSAQAGLANQAVRPPLTGAAVSAAAADIKRVAAPTQRPRHPTVPTSSSRPAGVGPPLSVRPSTAGKTEPVLSAPSEREGASELAAALAAASAAAGLQHATCRDTVLGAPSMSRSAPPSGAEPGGSQSLMAAPVVPMPEPRLESQPRSDGPPPTVSVQSAPRPIAPAPPPRPRPPSNAPPTKITIELASIHSVRAVSPPRRLPLPLPACHPACVLTCVRRAPPRTCRCARRGD